MSQNKTFQRIKRKLKRNNIITYKAFKEKYPQDYEISLKGDFLHEFKLKILLPSGYWTKERVIKESKKYKNPTEFEKKSGGAYRAAIKYGILKSLVPSSHMNKSKAVLIAKKYKTRMELKNKEPQAFNYIYEKKIHEEAFSHMKRGRRDKRHWTKDLLWEVRKRNKKRKDFIKELGPRGIKFAQNINIYDDLLCSYSSENKPSGYWIRNVKEIFNIAKKFKNRSEFCHKESGAYMAAKKLNILNEVCSHMESLCKPNGYWSEKRIKTVANKCKTKTEFGDKYPVAYTLARKLGIINKVCSHMTTKVNHREKMFVNSLCCKIIKIDKNIKIEREVLIGLGSRIDLILHLSEFELSIPVEIKHGETKNWTKAHVKTQKSKYDKILKNRKGFTRTYVVSPKGKWGYSEEEFLEIIKHLVEKEELYSPLPLNQLAA